MTQPHLFTDLRIRDVVLKNRIVVAPMWQYSGQDGFPTDWHLMNLGRLANGGAGLVFQEGTTVAASGRGTPGDIGIWDDAFIAPLTRLVSIMRSNGAVPGIQLMHAGRKGRQATPIDGRGVLQRTPDMTDWDAWEPSGPSAIPIVPGDTPPRAMPLAEVQAMIQAFGDAARRAQACGYDVLELHSAHGYLIHSFLCEASNQRTDVYGGSFANRARFLLDTVEAVRAEWPAGKPLFVRLSCIDRTGWTMADTIALTRLLMARGVDVIDCTSGGLTGSPLPSGQKATYGYQAAYAAELRRETGVLAMAVGLIVHAEQADRLIRDGSADLAALARELIYNPNWPIDAAHKLGAEAGFSVTDPRTAFWLRHRAESVPTLTPSTFTPGNGVRA
ncbi:NADH:flavin oxidoreductase/NADH oxidase [Zavarzinia sp. CC-PAN008]|uniref:NADH:flavin oxidoreductase/NADH oxidase n=1 Tax=Zavarzinia sp. CC-PAN008 TaxID=3243332 RepID=UPI003F74A130